MSKEVKRYAKGEIIFHEGDIGRSMYVVSTGSLRLSKKKGNGSIELGVIHRGEVLGEMAFLDGSPRSATVEAISECELIEISNGKDTTMAALPEWIQILLKSVVKRLRTASNRIKQLENSSISYSVDEKGKRSAIYEFIGSSEMMKSATALLLVGTRNGKKVETPVVGYMVRAGLIQKYAASVMGVHLAKLTEMLDIYQKANLLLIEKKEDRVEVIIRDLNFFEHFAFYMSEESQKDESKKMILSKRSALALKAIAKYIDDYEKNDKGYAVVNLAKIMKFEMAGKKLADFALDDIEALKKYCLADDIKIHDSSTITTSVPVDQIKKLAPIYHVISLVDELNDKKRNNY